VASKLLAPPKASEKTFKLDEHVFAAVAGLTSDAAILVNYARLTAQRHRFTYGEEQPVESLVQLLCDYKHSYTQYGGLRPFGVSFLYAGWDRHAGFQLYQSDPSGNYSGWRAAAIGANAQSATAALKADYSESMTLAQATRLAVRTLAKALDTTNPSADKMEVAVLSFKDGSNKKEVTQRPLTAADLTALLAEIATSTASAGDV